MAETVRYRKLPGHRRGFFRGSSVWLGPDHLLLVKSMRFREEYKRYQLRDIQAIVVARAPRFHISTRSFGIAALWLLAYFIVMFRGSWAHALMWSSAALFVLAWLVISWFFSCTCRINTAVSRDHLPSVYRAWTARRFLRQVEPLIVQAQGALQGPWADAVEEKNVGPMESVAPVFQGAAVAPPPVARTRTLATDLLLGALFADAIWNAVNLHANPGLPQAVSSVFTLFVIGTAIAVIVQRYRGLLRPAIQRLAMVALAGIGLLYYFQPLVVGMLAGIQASANRKAPNILITTTPWTRGAEAIMTAVLGLLGLAILLFSRSDHPPGATYPST